MNYYTTILKTLYVLFCIILLASCGAKDIKSIVVRGSDTEVNLVLQISEEFMDKNLKTSIAVTGGGSGTGIAALINKKTDIANSSRAFKPEEKKLAKKNGVNVVPIIFGIDAVSFVVNENMPIDSLSIQQVREIFTGKKTNWADFGGPDAKISLFGRQGNSGTFTFIQQKILKDNYSLQMKQMNGTSQIIEGIKHDVNGIGYVGIGYIVKKDGSIMKGVKPLSIRGEKQHKAISPIKFTNIVNGDYKISRPLYQYVDGIPTGLIKQFLLYELSDRGQEIIKNNGYFPISEQYKKLNDEYLNKKQQ